MEPSSQSKELPPLLSNAHRWIYGIAGIIFLLILFGGKLYALSASLVFSKTKGLPFTVVSRYYQLKGEYGNAFVSKCLKEDKIVYDVEGAYSLGPGMVYYYDASGKLISKSYISDNPDPVHPPQLLPLTNCVLEASDRKQLPDFGDLIRAAFSKIWSLFAPLGK
jgi:hypothetical protein